MISYTKSEIFSMVAKNLRKKKKNPTTNTNNDKVETFPAWNELNQLLALQIDKLWNRKIHYNPNLNILMGTQ